MRLTALFITALLLTHFSFGQAQDVWVRFYDTKKNNSGYKDLKGKIKIPAKFEEVTRADTFYNIIAVMEAVDLKTYYLLKDGREVGHDSVFMYDFTFDCESEGKIIFSDRKKDRVGFFDKNGVAIIGAIYNYVSPFRNSLAVAHRNARRKCWEEGVATTKCEHLGWEGGETILINEKNEILADSLNLDLSSINWYSKRIDDSSIDTSIYVSIKGKNGLTYWFVDYDKEFKKWFFTTFIQTLKNNGNLQSLIFDEVTYLSRRGGWTSLRKNTYLKTFPAALTTKRFEPSKFKELSISQEIFNEHIFEKSMYKKYLNSCGESNKDRYPLYNVTITYIKHRQKPQSKAAAVEAHGIYETDYQEHFKFLRTENGYRLLKVLIKR